MKTLMNLELSKILTTEELAGLKAGAIGEPCRRGCKDGCKQGCLAGQKDKSETEKVEMFVQP
ncbi:MAG: hypothetical protein GQ574_19945 [Crocinitomix sp.]|nr:hypothetical protein [Crocinitomix sp.]